MIFFVAHAEHRRHRYRKVPEITIGPDWSRLCICGRCLSELVGIKNGGVHDVPVCIVDVRSHVPTDLRSIPVHNISRIDFKDISATTCFRHRGIDGHAVNASNRSFILAKEQRITCLCRVACTIIGVFFIPNRHGNAIARSV